MSAVVVRSIAGLRALRDEWEGLSAQMACPMLDHDWVLTCAETLHAEQDLRVVTVREQGVLTGVAPLVFERTPFGGRLGLLGASTLYEPGGWVFASSDAVRELIQPVLRLAYALVLLRVPTQSPLCALLAEGMRRRALVATRATRPSLGVDTRGCWDDYCDGLSSHTTKNLPRLWRRAERAFGRVVIATTTPAPAEVDSALEQLVAVENSGWKGQKGSSLRNRRDLFEFFHRYARRMALARSLRMTTLWFGSQAAAVELGVEAYGRMWQLKIGYNAEVASFYPGLHLTQASIRSAFERRLASYEFLGVAEPWEERWRPAAREYRTIAIYPSSVRGMASACGDLGASVWRRARRSLRSAADGVAP